MINLYKIPQIMEHVFDIFIGICVKKKVKNAKLAYGLNQDEERKNKIILSLTTYNKRYEFICLTLKSLLLQTKKPDKIIVWLDADIPENEITEEMRAFKKYGIEYRHTNFNLKPHTKYYYAMQEFPNDIIITVDDDIIYPPNMIDELMSAYKKYPNTICARRVHLMTFDASGNLKNYNDWNYEYRHLKTPSYLLCATGVGGVLYPPHILPKEAFNINNIKKYCLTADDIWLKVMETKNKVKVVWAENHLVLPPFAKHSQKLGLNKKNVILNENDIFICNLQKEYPSVFNFLSNYKTLGAL